METNPNPHQPPAADDPDTSSGAAPPELPHVVILTLLFEGGLVLLALGLGELAHYGPLQTFPQHGEGILQGLMIGTLATLPLLLGLVVIDRYPLGPLADLKRVVEDLILPMFRGVSLLSLALISLLAGLGEEMLFRGLLQGGLAQLLSNRLGPTAAATLALLAASLIFGLVHPITRLYAFLCFVIGLYLGYLWIHTGNLLAPIVTHALYDFFALVYLTRGGGLAAAGKGEPGQGPPQPEGPAPEGPPEV